MELKTLQFSLIVATFSFLISVGKYAFLAAAVVVLDNHEEMLQLKGSPYRGFETTVYI